MEAFDVASQQTHCACGNPHADSNWKQSELKSEAVGDTDGLALPAGAKYDCAARRCELRGWAAVAQRASATMRSAVAADDILVLAATNSKSIERDQSWHRSYADTTATRACRFLDVAEPPRQRFPYLLPATSTCGFKETPAPTARRQTNRLLESAQSQQRCTKAPHLRQVEPG